MVQYDEEQARLESRIAELETPEETTAPKKADINRFIALVRKYQNITELTDEMLYEFVEKIVIHAPTGGRTIYRRQRLDIYFNFIGHYLPPMPEPTEEELRAEAEAASEAKKKEKAERAKKKQREKLADLKAKAETDPEAATEYQRYRDVQNEAKRKRVAERKAQKEADPEYQAKKEAKRIERNKKTNDRYHRKHIPIGELEKMAETDPQAAEELKNAERHRWRRTARTKQSVRKGWLKNRNMPKRSAERQTSATRQKRRSARLNVKL